MFDKNELNCSLCYTNYGTGFPQRIPRVLDCGHTYCTECLTKLKDLHGDVVECPSCKLRTLLPDDNVESLTKNLEILKVVLHKEDDEQVCNFCVRKIYPPKPATFYCGDCEVYSCGTCSDEIHSQVEFRTHSICLASITRNNNSVESGSSRSSVRSSSANSSKRSSSAGSVNRLQSSLLDYASIPDCPEHGAKLKFYCRECKCICCSHCQTYGHHKGHSSFEVHEAEEQERKLLCKIQARVEQHAETFIKARAKVQRTIEEVKKDGIVARDVACRYYRELRAAIDQAEKMLLEEIEKRSKAKLRALNEQVGQMIDIASQAKTASRNCANILSQDYYDMLTKKKDVEDEMLEVLELLCEVSPVTQADLKCQFPNHEKMLSSIRTCAKLVLPPGPPEKLTCSLTKNEYVEVRWNPPEQSIFIYPVVLYALQASTGPDNSFVEVARGCEPSYKADLSQGPLPHGKHIQFRAAAVNTVGQGPWGFPYGMKMPPKNA